MDNRDKSILVGLFLSKFDREGLDTLGFQGFTEAYNAFGQSLGISPNSIKNYRDEFDPQFPNKRSGWRKRPMKENCQNIFNEFSHLDIDSFVDLLKDSMIDNFDIERLVRNIENRDYTESVAKRLITGKAAEKYFKSKYESIGEFVGYSIKDTTLLACGFDFKLSKEDDFYCVEVKGLSRNSGTISLTEKEFDMARVYSNKFCLFVVSGFVEKIKHQYFFDPLNSRLSFEKVERPITQISYNTAL